MLPSLQKNDPTWPELRSMGVGWWLRSTNKLRRCIEKVRSLMSRLTGSVRIDYVIPPKHVVKLLAKPY